MSFMDFSLCPGGAFMMHESVTEFDPTAAEIAAPATPKEEIVKAVEAMDTVSPVVKLANALKPCADKVDTLMKCDLSADDAQSAMERLDYIADSARDITETLRMLLVKLKAIASYVSTDSYKLDPIIRNGKFFITHKQYLHEQGLDAVALTREESPATSCWNMSRAAMMYFNMYPELPSAIIDISTLMYGEDFLNDRFSSIHDYITCMLYDPERTRRLTRMESTSLDIYYSAFARNTGNEPAIESEDSYREIAAIIDKESSHLRQICNAIYDRQCAIIDGEFDRTSVSNTLRTTIVGTVNIYYVISMLLITLAYRTQNNIQMRAQIETYVNDIMLAFRNKQ